jgi:hypothetical protein
MVQDSEVTTGKRTSTLYRTTDIGLEALQHWVEQLPDTDQVVIKHPVILKAWMSKDSDATRTLDALDRHLEATRKRLDEALWSRQRTREVGISEEPSMRMSLAVLNYSIRALYAELSNIAQLRDEVAVGTAEDPARRVHRPEGQLRRTRD